MVGMRNSGELNSGELLISTSSGTIDDETAKLTVKQSGHVCQHHSKKWYIHY